MGHLPFRAQVHRFLGSIAGRAGVAGVAGLVLLAPLDAKAAPNGPSEVAFANGFPVTSPRGIYPLSRIKRGDKGIGYTVFSEDRITPFQVEILGVLENMLGPGKDILFARLSGPEIEFTGVISGMSGSPVYIDGQLVGAVSYRFGSFSKEPIAGITPIESMIAIRDTETQRGASAKLEEARGARFTRSRPLRLADYRSRDGFPAPAGLEATAGAGQRLGPKSDADPRPIETPIVMSGVDPTVAEEMKSRLEAAGFVVSIGPSGAPARAIAPRAKDGARIIEKNAGSMAGRVRAAPIAPGAPIAAVLMRGDLVVAATGTVTFVDGSDVLAFGHPFMGYGTVAFPMATASIIHTLATPLGSYKQGAPALEVGSITHDRLTAIGGRIGGVAPMVPAHIRVSGFDPVRGEATTDTRVEIVDHEVWLPILLEMAVGSSASGRLTYEAGGTVELKARIEVDDRTLDIVDTYSAESPIRVSAFAARDVANTLSIITQNDFSPVHVKSVDVDLKVKREVCISTIQELVPDRTVVRAGEKLGLTVRLRPRYGQPSSVRMTVEVPADFLGDADVFVGGGIEMDGRENDAKGNPSPANVEDLLGILAERRPARALYARVIAPRPGLRDNAEVLSSLPASQRTALAGQIGRAYRNVSEALGTTAEREHADVIMGSATAQIHVVR